MMLNPYVLITFLITITAVLLVIICSQSNNRSPQPLKGRRTSSGRESGLPRRSSEWSSGEKSLNYSNRHSTLTSRTNGIDELAATL